MTKNCCITPRWSMITSLILMLFFGGLKSGKADTPQAFLKINQYYILFTNPIVPFIDKNGNFIVGLQGFSDLVGATTVIAEGSTTIRLGSESVRFSSTSKTAHVNGTAVEMAEVPPRRATLQEDVRFLPFATRKLIRVGSATQLLVPVALLARAFDLKSSWQPKTRTLLLERRNLVLPDDGSIEAENLERFEYPVLKSVGFVPVRAIVRSGSLPFNGGPKSLAEAESGKVLDLSVKNISDQDITTGQAYINIFGSYLDKGMPMPSVDIPTIAPASLKAGAVRSDVTEIKGASTLGFVSYIAAWLVVREFPPSAQTTN